MYMYVCVCTPPHRTAKCTGVSMVLNGDGYTRWYKPFRTVEDIYVQSSFISYMIRCIRLSFHRLDINNIDTRYHSPSSCDYKGDVGSMYDVLSWCINQLVTLRGISMMDPTSVTTHIALSHCIEVY